MAEIILNKMYNLFNPIKYLLDNISVEKYVLPFNIRKSDLITVGIKYFEKMNKNEEKPTTSEPIFILSAGWGSGSTLLQRLIVSSKEVYIWGEPYDLSAIIQKMSSFLAPINKEWPPDKFFDCETPLLKLSDKWIGNLYPRLYNLKRAQREFFLELFEKPITKYNVDRWGIKEVRLTVDHANFLKWLFPKSKFIFLYRNLYDCYLSIRNTTWFSYWPNYRIGNPIYFAHYWKKLVKGFRLRHNEVNGLLIKYEDLISEKNNFEKIINHLKVNAIDNDVLKNKLGSRGSGKKLKSYEKIILKAIGHEEMKLLYPELKTH